MSLPKMAQGIQTITSTMTMRISRSRSSSRCDSSVPSCSFSSPLPSVLSLLSLMELRRIRLPCDPLRQFPEQWTARSSRARAPRRCRAHGSRCRHPAAKLAPARTRAPAGGRMDSRRPPALRRCSCPRQAVRALRRTAQRMAAGVLSASPARFCVARFSSSRLISFSSCCGNRAPCARLADPAAYRCAPGPAAAPARAPPGRRRRSDAQLGRELTPMELMARVTAAGAALRRNACRCLGRGFVRGSCSRGTPRRLRSDCLICLAASSPSASPSFMAFLKLRIAEPTSPPMELSFFVPKTRMTTSRTISQCQIPKEPIETLRDAQLVITRTCMIRHACREWFVAGPTQGDI